MIRRGFWFTVGAVGGIMAYRRAAEVANKPATREALRFARDVRKGMDLYMARHPRRVTPTLGAQADDEKDDHDAVG
jgi:hypothetical protein